MVFLYASGCCFWIRSGARLQPLLPAEITLSSNWEWGCASSTCTSILEDCPMDRWTIWISQIWAFDSAHAWDIRTAFLDIGRTQAELVCFAMFPCFTHHFSSGTTLFPLPKAPPFVARALEATTMAYQPLCLGCQLLRQYGAQGKQSHGPVAQQNLKHEIEACH